MLNLYGPNSTLDIMHLLPDKTKKNATMRANMVATVDSYLAIRMRNLTLF